MKTLKWLWVAALLTIGFKLYGLLSAGPNGYGSNDMESFVGMVFAFALISVVLIVVWIIGRTKKTFSSKLSKNSNSEQP